MSEHDRLSFIGDAMLALFFIACGPKADIQLAHRSAHTDTLHGEVVADPYRWMEKGDSADVKRWTEERNLAFRKATDPLTGREWLSKRFNTLWRYDDESVPKPCLLDRDKVIYWTKSKDQDKWVVNLRHGGIDKVLIDPNTWKKTETLNVFSASPDCKLAAIGKANAGDENPVLKLMNLETGEMLSDSFQGWRHGGVDWLHDNSGLFYSTRPLAEDAPNGEKDYYHRAMFHPIGSDGSKDTIILENRDVKEQFHAAGVSEDGQTQVFGRYSFDTSKFWIKRQGETERIELMPEMDAEYNVTIIGERLFIRTDWKAPNYRVMTASLDKPQREHWTEYIPESDDVLKSFSGIGGHFYATYQHKASTRIDVYKPEGKKLQTVELPAIGSGSVSGHWAHPDVFLRFQSFAHPSATYSYDVTANTSKLLKKSPLDIDTSNVDVSQVFYPSKDGEKISMFVLRPKNIPKDQPIPFLLTGYGGFNISLLPRFSTRNIVWLESGGGIAIPNLRGGGEYGAEWHKAGMREKKQNVFDDFIGAAEYLISSKLAKPSAIAISGGSNGGLLVSAAVTQRPELFKAVLCAVPLTDMVRFHHFGLANIWSEEYGNADNPDHFKYIYAYSPYHQVKKGVDYPAILVTGSENDARTDPVHARKFAAAIRWADAEQGEDEPILLHIQTDSGHGGGVNLDKQIDQMSRHYGFLMHAIGLEAPKESK